jgi:dinuclear metal center YbgI/SA1388 family protein
MADLKEIVAFLDAELRLSEIKDYPGAMNGLQLENDGTVERVFSAVDASLAVVEEAAAAGGGLLLVHHGMFWQGAQPITGAFHRKITAAIRGNLAIYSAHLPLDWHPVHGNNVLLAKAIGLREISPILVKDGWPMGVAGLWEGSRGDLVKTTSVAVGREVTLCPGGSDQVGKVAIITGGAGSEVGKIAEFGADAFVTGEGPHWSFIEAEERRINLIYAGHYATETFGVKSLGGLVGKRFGKEVAFIDRPSGL